MIQRANEFQSKEGSAMEDVQLTVIAEIKAKSGCEAALKQELLKLVAPTHQEEGCLDYDLHESLERAGEFVFYENWTSREALEEHLESAHLKAFRTVSGELLREPVKIALYQRIAAKKGLPGGGLPLKVRDA